MWVQIQFYVTYTSNGPLAAPEPGKVYVCLVYYLHSFGRLISYGLLVDDDVPLEPSFL